MTDSDREENPYQSPDESAIAPHSAPPDAPKKFSLFRGFATYWAVLLFFGMADMVATHRPHRHAASDLLILGPMLFVTLAFVVVLLARRDLRTAATRRIAGVLILEQAAILALYI
jgi:hypothetical protein